MRFAAPDPLPPDAAPGLLGFRLEKQDVIRLAETALLGLVAVLALLLVLRPLALRLGAPVLAVTEEAGAKLAVAEAALPPPPGKAEHDALLEDQSMVDVANVEGQMRASSIRRVSDLVERHPDETLAVLRGWMAQEGG
jgi:flagellar M-ring protein FliF